MSGNGPHSDNSIAKQTRKEELEQSFEMSYNNSSTAGQQG